jgi:hypothetical protein
MWIARDKNGSLWLYTNKPTRKENVFADGKTFSLLVPQDLFDEVTWENSPKEAYLRLMEDEVNVKS